MSSARFLAETWGYFRNSSIISTWVMSILRQQYRLIPSSSSTLMGLSPARTRRLNVSHLSAICLPQVKHLTGMIISFLSLYLYDFCFLRRALGPPNFLGSVTLWSPAIITLSYARKVFLNSLPFVHPANARAIAMRAASAWAITPPPSMLTLISTALDLSPAINNGSSIFILATSGNM